MKIGNHQFIRKKIVCLVTAACLILPGNVPVLADDDSETNVITSEEIKQEEIVEVTDWDESVVETESQNAMTGKEEDLLESTTDCLEEVQEADEDIQNQEETAEVYSAGNPEAAVENCDENTGEFIIRIQGVTVQAGEQIIVPVWQAAKQEDIIWHTAEKEGDCFLVKDSVARHGYRTGTYNIHVYKRAANGTMTFLTYTTEKIQPQADSLSVAMVGGTKARITLKGLKSYGALKEIRFAVWTAVNGQDDIRWYQTPVTGQELEKEIDLSVHQGSGQCYIHTYAFTKTGDGICINTSSFEKQSETAAKSITVSGPASDTGDFSIVVKGVPVTGVKSVSIPVWSKADQSDIVWYTAEKTGQDYIVRGNLSKHSWNTGTYHIHVYQKNTSGEMILFGSEKMSAAAPTVKDISVSVNGDSFKIVASGISSGIGITEVQIPVWSKADQSDIVWYSAKKVNDSYVVESNTSLHKYNSGTYTAHLYVKGNDRKGHFLGAKSFQIQAQSSTMAVESVGTGTNFKIILKNCTSGEKVKFAVWSKENGQDDIQWYDAVESGSDYIYEVTGSKHLTNGIIHVHAYLFNPDGSAKLLTTAEYEMKYTRKNEVIVSNVDNRLGTCDVTVRLAEAATVKSVSIAIWSRSDQSNIKWYPAQKQADGTYLVKMNVLNHGSESGTYHIHAYAYDASGKPAFVGDTSVDMQIPVGISLEKTNSWECQVVIPASLLSKDTVEVFCPAWSVTGGQDDLVWYKAVKRADGAYVANIAVGNHLHSGEYIIDCYSKNQAGEMKLIQRLTVTLSGGREFDAEARAVMRKIIYAVETGGQVYGRQRYDAFTEAYTNSSGETAITIGAGQWFATEAKRLLTLIRDQYPATFVQYDTAGIAADLVNENWKYYGSDGAGHKTILKGSAKAVAIQNIINSAGGIAVQDSLVDEQMVKYADQAKALGVTDLKARLFCANIQHLGGYNAMVRIINYCKNDGDALTMENLWTNMRQREAGSGNYVGSDLYASRHQKVMNWLNTYL